MEFKLKRIDRYIIKQFLGTYIFAIALIIAISVVFDINEKIDKFLSPDVPLKAIVFDYYMNFIPYFANLFSPLFTFVAVIFFTSKLADNSEVIAMLASGMSFRRLMLPYAISAGIIALSTFALNAYIIPPANATRIDFQNKYIKNKKVDYVRSAQLEIEPGVIAYFDRYDARSGMGYKFSLEHFEDKKLVSRLTANSIKYDSLYNWIVIDYMIRDSACKLHFVRYDNHGDPAVPLQIADDLQHLARKFGIECGCRLVEAQNIRLQRHGARNRHTLALPARKLARVIFRLVLQTEFFEQLRRRLVHRLFK